MKNKPLKPSSGGLWSCVKLKRGRSVKDPELEDWGRGRSVKVREPEDWELWESVVLEELEHTRSVGCFEGLGTLGELVWVFEVERDEACIENRGMMLGDLERPTLGDLEWFWWDQWKLWKPSTESSDLDGSVDG